MQLQKEVDHNWPFLDIMDLQEVQYQNLLLLNPLNYLIFTKRTISDYGSPSPESDYSDYASCNILYVYNVVKPANFSVIQYICTAPTMQCYAGCIINIFSG